MTRNKEIIKKAFQNVGLMTPALERILGQDMADAARKGGIDKTGMAYGKQFPRLPFNPPDQSGKPMGKAAEIIAVLVKADRPMKRAEIAAEIGVKAESIKDVFLSLRNRGIISAENTGRNVFIYRYLGASKAISKPREWAKPDTQAARVAQATQGRSTGENVGVV